jgi:hypothetical protein
LLPFTVKVCSASNMRQVIIQHIPCIPLLSLKSRKRTAQEAAKALLTDLFGGKRRPVEKISLFSAYSAH